MTIDDALIQAEQYLQAEYNRKNRKWFVCIKPCEVPLNFPTAMNSSILSFTSLKP
jgi:hypothetical protein